LGVKKRKRSSWEKTTVIREIRRKFPDGIANSSHKSGEVYRQALLAFGSWDKACNTAGVETRSQRRRRLQTTVSDEELAHRRRVNEMTPAAEEFVEALVKEARGHL